MRNRISAWRVAGIAAAAGGLALALATALAQRPLPESLVPEPDNAARFAVVDRNGQPLTVTYQSRWNLNDRRALEDQPRFLREAIVEAEDRRFWSHYGVDWLARFAAVWQDAKHFRAVRGASTISEQVVRLLHPRPRTLWSRWVEGFEAFRLERRFDKSAILEFYLDQVPFGANRKGVVQAARYYFGRSPETLSESEMLALAVMPRAPSRLDPMHDPRALEGPMRRLALRLRADALIDAAQLAAFAQPPPALRAEDDSVPAAHYLAELRRRAEALFPAGAPTRLRASLDADLQREAQALLDRRLQDLARAGVRQGGLVVVDLQGNKIRAWAVSDLDADAATGERGIDTVRALRQPGSALKPFVYALAIESGMNAETRIEDGALAAHVGDGLHPYRNYSRLHYGEVSLREALGNSLNIPAVKTLQIIGGERLLTRLRQLGMSDLRESADWYGNGLALGNGEVTLLQLVQAYAALARQGRWRPLSLFEEPLEGGADAQVISRAAAAAITDILSDSRARLLEFGNGGLLRFPAETAVKTGTSSDYRDAWTVGYDRRYVVGAWFGDLVGRATDGVTGAIGPALLVRSVFAVLNRSSVPAPLERGNVRRAPDASDMFEASGETPAAVEAAPAFVQPFEGLHVALDPRVPRAQQALEFKLGGVPGLRGVRWYVDGAEVARTADDSWLWPLARGAHSAAARVELASGTVTLAPVGFLVK